MKVLMIEPGKAPYEAELDGSLESMQEAVGGGIEGYYPYAEPVAIVCNDEGKINGLPLNRAIYNQDGEMIEIMAGTFFIAGLGEESFADLPDYFMEQYKEQFKYPEKFYRLAGEIVAVKQPLPPEEKQQPVPAMEEPGGDDIRLDESTDLAFDLDPLLPRRGGRPKGGPEKGVQNHWFWRVFGYFCRGAKVTAGSGAAQAPGYQYETTPPAARSAAKGRPAAVPCGGHPF